MRRRSTLTRAMGSRFSSTDSDETSPLLAGGNGGESFAERLAQGFSSVRERRKHRNKIYAGVTIFILGLAALFLYLALFHNFIRIKVVSMNVWGLPGGIGGCVDKAERIEALSKVFAKGDFDLFLLQELWMEADHTLLNNSLPEGYYMTGFRQLSSSWCDGRVLPTSCSGLAIASRLPFVDVAFDMYTWRGTVWDAEAFAGKGVGRVRVQLEPGLDLDVFTTHTIADSGTTMANNTWYRVKQVEELVNEHMAKSNASAVVLGADLNTPPVKNKGDPYEIIEDFMTNSVEELFSALDKWLGSAFATYGNKHNTFTSKEKPMTIDYIFHRVNCPHTTLWTQWFELPLFKTWFKRVAVVSEVEGESVEGKDEEISLSDHEAVISTLHIRKHSRMWPHL